MAPRRSLSDLLSDVDANAAQPPAPSGPPPSSHRGGRDPGAPAARPNPPPARRPPEAATPAGPDRQAPEVPKYRTLDRKELLARPDQLEELFALRRRLNKKRAAREGERITENTLIRVAVDLLLAQADLLAGTSEDELRESVTRGVRERGQGP